MRSIIYFMTNLQAILGDEDAVLIMDNAPCYKNIGFDIKYLPPHSPFLNPIEECFSVFKSYSKHRLNDISAMNLDDPAAARLERVPMYRRRLQRLRTAVDETLDTSITRELVATNYQHSNTYLIACIQEQDIIH